MSRELSRRDLALAVCGGAAAVGLARRATGQGPAVGSTVETAEALAREASWYTKLDEGRVECNLCPRACQVANAERGFCGVRENRDGRYYTLVHSVACTLHEDPIEKKPFFHFLPGETALSFATAGCNAECKFCQNWEISQFRPEQVKAVYLPPEALAASARRAGIPILTSTYSEPVVFWEYVRDTAVAGKQLGLRSTVVTNGYIQERPLRDVLPHLAAVKVDLKSFREGFYRDLVRAELKPVLKALEVIRASGVWLEIVVLVIPTLNDSEAEIRDLARWVKNHLGAGVPVHFTRFHPTYRLLNLPPTPLPTLERAWTVARGEGLEFTYLGNVPGHIGECTTCPGCGAMLVKRIGFKVLANNLKGGKCPTCARAIPGVWS